MERIGAPYGKSPAQVVLRRLRQEGIVAILKSVHKDRIEQNFQVDDFTLTPEEMEAVRGLDTGNSLILDLSSLDEVYRLHNIRFGQ